ncbi:antitoxin [Haloferula sp. A504]|uniref:antitoxin n=1 Tax=Haloferula sp. A504 TaxID=3373601 RepID=UPI0031BD093A|nr:AbrB/MazE/SpoVT family DNA-binding domain-containing protein [Verrucomicrobiaceae bacterium E54]
MKTRVFRSGNSLAVRLPKEMALPCGPVSIRREGSRIVIEEMNEGGWPEGFFDGIRIKRKSFGREVPEFHEKKL